MTTGIRTTDAGPGIEVRHGASRPADAAPALLETARLRLEPALRTALQRLPDTVLPVALYHYGWLDTEGNECDAGRGKALRPTLALLAAQAVGPRGSDIGSSTTAVDDHVLAAAVAVDLVHNFSLLHDDVMDGDTTRRHRATAWSVFGVGPAVLAGDALLTLAMQTLAGIPEAAAVTADAVQELILGQVQDLTLERRETVTLAECLSMAGAKTGALIGCSCAVGALAAGASPEQVRRLDRAGRDLGLAFQLIDDELGIWGDPAVTGKPAGADLRSRKKSLPVVAALTSGTPAGRELSRLYRSHHDLGPDETARAADLVEEAGGRDWALRQAEELLSKVEDTLSEGEFDDVGAAGLRSLAHLCVHRQS